MRGTARLAACNRRQRCRGALTYGSNRRPGTDEFAVLFCHPPGPSLAATTSDAGLRAIAFFVSAMSANGRESDNVLLNSEKVGHASQLADSAGRRGSNSSDLDEPDRVLGRRLVHHMKGAVILLR
jgi:hypothetical protein